MCGLPDPLLVDGTKQAFSSRSHRAVGLPVLATDRHSAFVVHWKAA